MTTPTLIQDLNLSQSWLKTLKEINDNTGKELSPLVLTITDFNETLAVREVLDAHLATNTKQSIQTVSETIFPISLQRLFKDNRQDFYAQYIDNFPRIKKLDSRNKRGTYFQRLINFSGVENNINQLENIIVSIKDTENNRRTKYQASIFDPTKDHINNPYQGFPCLQHVTFYVTNSGGLVLNSFYALQHLYDKAYGNWLGLINLGEFVSNELDMPFERFNCFISIEKLDTLTKTEAKKLYAQASKGINI